MNENKITENDIVNEDNRITMREAFEKEKLYEDKRSTMIEAFEKENLLQKNPKTQFIGNQETIDTLKTIITGGNTVEDDEIEFNKTQVESNNEISSIPQMRKFISSANKKANKKKSKVQRKSRAKNR
jgi:hypothetical protein